jgi:hypothetical protein
MVFLKNIFKGNCRGILAVVTISLLLIVAVTGFLFFSNWYNNFIPEVQSETFGTYSFTTEYVDFLSIRNNSGNYSLIIRNRVKDNFKIEMIRVDEVMCLFVGDGIIYRNSITTINLSCSDFNDISDILVITEFDLININVLLE